MARCSDLGVAREWRLTGAMSACRARDGAAASGGERVQIDIADASLCARYTAP